MLRLAESALVTRTINRLVRDLLDLFILYTLYGGAKSGYDIKKLLGQLFGVRVSYGSLYPHLHSLEKSGIIVGQWVPHAKAKDMQKKQYSLTETGRASLQANVEALSRISLTLQLEMAGVSREIVAREIVPLPTAPLVTFLRSKGFRIQSNATLQGKSGSQHEVDIFAVRSNKEGDQRILVGISLGDSPLGIGEVIRLYTQGYDLTSTLTILIAVPGLTDEAKKLADFYGMKVFETTNLDELMQGIGSSLDKLVP